MELDFVVIESHRIWSAKKSIIIYVYNLAMHTHFALCIE